MVTDLSASGVGWTIVVYGRFYEGAGARVVEGRGGLGTRSCAAAV